MLLQSLVREDHDVEYATPTESGGLRVGVLWPASARILPPHLAGAAPELVQLEFDADGRLVRREQGEGRHHLIWDYEYDARSPDGFPIPSRVVRTAMYNNTTSEVWLLEVRTHSLTDPLSFDPEYVRTRMVEADKLLAEGLARQRVRQAVGADSRTRSDGGAADSPPGGAITTSEARPEAPTDTSRPLMPPGLSPYERYRWPLVLSGVIVAAIALIARWKSARG